MKNKCQGIDKKMPENMNRKEKIAMVITYLKAGQDADAWSFYLRHCAGISKKACHLI